MTVSLQQTTKRKHFSEQRPSFFQPGGKERLLYHCKTLAKESNIMSIEDELPSSSEVTIAAVSSTTQKAATYDSFYDEQVYLDGSASDDESVEPVEHVNSTRLDITITVFAKMSKQQKQSYIDTFVDQYKDIITTIHLSGQRLHHVLTTEQITALIRSIGQIHSITEFFCFHGGSKVLTSDLLAQGLPPNLRILMLWHFPSISNQLAAAMRQQKSLTRVTLNLSSSRKKQLQWGCLDVCAMAFASMEQLQVLQIRCVPQTDHHDLSRIVQQSESIITPEAIVPLLNSPSITQLYLENCGLIDDHMDEVYNELPNNLALVTLDLKGNMFSDDCLYTTGRLLPIAPPQFQFLDISGVHITEGAGKAVAIGMAKNNSLQSLEIEGTLLRFHDEFDIPIGHTNTEWMQDINHQLRLNRAYQMGTETISSPDSHKKAKSIAYKQNVMSSSVESFVVAVSAVSDSVSCIYHFLRTYPDHCTRLTAPLPHIEPRASTSDVES
jgi:hypothetical protein